MKTIVRELKTFDMCNDYMFKSEFRSIEARRVVARFLNELTGIDIDIIMNADFQGGELPKINEKEKGKICDCIVKISDDKRLIVEMNGNETTYASKKATSYAYGVITETTRPNNRYPDILLICIDNFNQYKTKEDILEFQSRDLKGHIENDLYKSYHIILENSVNSEYNEIKKFSKFLKMTNIEEMREFFKGDKDYMDAIDKVEEYTKDPDFIGYYDEAKQIQRDMNDIKNQGYEDGLAKGINQRNLELAKKMLDEKIDIQIISKITELSISEIEKL